MKGEKTVKGRYILNLSQVECESIYGALGLSYEEGSGWLDDDVVDRWRALEKAFCKLLEFEDTGD